MPRTLDSELEAEAARRAALGLTRSTQLTGVPPGIDFGSNDYLGLSRHPQVVEAAVAATRAYGAGGRAARLLSGGCPLHESAEHALAAWLGSEAALLFPSGYQANVGLITALVGRGDAVISDRANHASLIDGARLSRARILVHAHADLLDLERALRAASGARRRLVLTEGIFSMGGDAPPLAEIDALCRRYDAWLVVDEAHSVGVLGPEGAGAWAASSVQGEHRLCARLVTGGKALGCAGAAIVGSAAMRTHLIHAARSFLFTTAPQPALAGAWTAAIQVCRAADQLRSDLQRNVRRLALRLGVEPPAGAIVPVPVGGASEAVDLANALRCEGFYVPAVRPPTVPEGRSQLRIVCHATHTLREVDALADALARRWPRSARSEPPSSQSPYTAPVTFVAGTDTNVGKTIVSALLLRAALRRSFTRYWKPVQTGADDDRGTVEALAEPPEGSLLSNLAWFDLPASPHEAAAAEGDRIHPGHLDDALELHRAETGPLLVELAGGLMVPYDLDPPYLQADWLAARGARVVLVARSGLGTLNHTLLSLEALRQRHIEVAALFLVGVPHPSNRRTLAQLSGIEHIFELPLLAELTPAALDSWIDVHPAVEHLS